VFQAESTPIMLRTAIPDALGRADDTNISEIESVHTHLSFSGTVGKGGNGQL